MKKIILIITGFLLIQGIFAQPTITQLMNLDIGDKYTAKNGGVGVSLTLISEGANQNWDFSNLPNDNNPATVICVASAETPFSDSTEVKSSNLALKPFGQDTDTMQIYQYVKVSNDKSETMAIGVYDRINKTNISYSKWLDPSINLKLPFTYGDSYTDRHVLWMNHIIQNTYILKDTSNTIVSAVGYGTLKTPAGTFQNVLLVKQTVSWRWWNNYDNQPYKTEGTDVNFQWFVPGIKVAVMSVNLVDESGGFVTYVSGTEFNKGGINNPDDSGSGTGGSGGSGGDDQPYDPSGIWLNTTSGGGGYFEKSNGSLSWTMGETITETIAVNPILTQGFNQPYVVSVSAKEIENGLELKVYPNPFTFEIIVDLGILEEKVDAALYSATGQIVRNFKLTEPINHLYLNECKPGMYYLKINNTPIPKTFKIIKK